MNVLSRKHLLAGLLLAAVAMPLAAQQRSYYSSDSRISVSKAPVYAPARITHISVKGSDVTIENPPVYPAPPFRIADYWDLNEQNLTAYLALRDTVQIRLAGIAQAKATDTRVRDLALMIQNDRVNRIVETTESIVDEHVGSQPMARDVELYRLAELIQHFDRMPAGAAFDAAYLQVTFFLHQNEIDVLTQNLKNAHDNDFEEVVEDAIENLTNTREITRGLTQAMGVSLP
jgi:hypothetical protein